VWAGGLILLGYLLGMRGVAIVEQAWLAIPLAALGIAALAFPLLVRLWRRLRFGPA
jgi:membrane protein DedA with SNARE-associated domain